MDIKYKPIFAFLFTILTLFYVVYITNVFDMLRFYKYNKPKQPITKYVAISASMDLEHDFYIFYLPMVCQAWRRVGFEPVVILAIPSQDDVYVNLSSATYPYNDNNDDDDKHRNIEFNATLNSLDRKAIEYLEFLNVKIFYLRTYQTYEPQFGQLSRVLVGYLSKEYIGDDNDLVLLTDSDLIPIKQSYYTMNEIDGIETDAIKVWNAFCCDRFTYKGRVYDQFPMSHVGMRKHEWRQLVENLARYNHTIGFDRRSLVNVFNSFYGRNCFRTGTIPGDDIWNIDQHLLSVQIMDLVERNELPLEKKPLTGTRLDRWRSSLGLARWRFQVNWMFFALTDAHCFKQTTFENIDLVRLFNRKLFHASFSALFDRYIDEYIEIRTRLKSGKPNAGDYKIVTVRNL